MWFKSPSAPNEQAVGWSAGKSDSDIWRQDWLAGMAEYGGYLDGASRETLAGKGGVRTSSNDLAGDSRMAALLEQSNPTDEVIEAARAQTELTHGDPGVSDAAAFFVHSVRVVEGGAGIGEAFRIAAEAGDYDGFYVRVQLEKARSAQGEPLVAGKELGLTISGD